MLAAAAAGSIFVLIAISLFVALLTALRRGSRKLRDSLVVRDGRPVLSDEARARLGKRGLDFAKIDSFIAETYVVNERGEIVRRAEHAKPETLASIPPTARPSEPGRSAPAKPQPATGRDAFQSVWEEQDAGPSIWDEADKSAFWGDAEKRE
jgi:hypothetical protein